ncbi:hypothetical protein F4775DRAFT_570462 [Biscogniauxia sp. FL1348]|nr:hypothetical protein F4775DRAFT_570462 [Biscogniauxia sp. FL1348]
MYRGKPPPSFLIPARDSRHRTACLALYRALLELAPKVALPEDLVPPEGRPNPVAQQIRRAFRRNREDVSPRIVYPALRAGYDALSALSAAAEHPSGAEYASVIALLRSRGAERARSAANRASPPKQRKLGAPAAAAPPRVDPETGEKLPKPGAPRPGTVPLLVNVTPAPTLRDPNPKPVYDTPSRPRPLSELGGSGRRQVPRLDMASDFAMLRLTKPQPAFLSRVLTQKVIKRAERGRLLQDMVEEGYAEAEGEDNWEMTLAQLLSDERWAAVERECDSDSPPKETSGGRGQEPLIPRLQREEYAIRLDEATRTTYRHHLRFYGIRYLQDLLSREREDQVARADAMRRLIAREAALAQQEKDERKKRSHEERHARWLARLAEAEAEDEAEGKREGKGEEERKGEIL